jgi:uroporphyrinogen-III synthase
MNPRQWLAVTTGQALRFFFERLKDVSDEAGPPVGELLYNASVLAHFATTSTASTT